MTFLPRSPFLFRALILSALLPSALPSMTLASNARPTPAQAIWQDDEVGMFIHFTHPPKLEDVNPAKLHTDQWVTTAEAMGAKYLIFVAKHEDGFCWWQTDTSPFSIKHTPWRNGQGDVVKELSASCQKRGMKFGIYLSPGDAVFHAAVHGVCKTPAEQEIYNQVYRAQLTELLTRYGEISEVWFDGSTVAEIGDLLKDHCPKAMVFQTTHATIRWVGTERGVAPYPAWNAVPLAKAKTGIATASDGRPDGDVWLPNECDTRTRVAAWFWSPDPKNHLKSLDELLTIYYQSVGRGAQSLLNVAPHPDGLIGDEDVQRMSEFGAEVRRRFGKSLGESSGKGTILELDLKQPQRIEHIITMEEILEGERVHEYVLEGFTGDTWKELCKGTAIGHKRIDRFTPVEVSKVRLRIVKSSAEPLIRKLAAFSPTTITEKTSPTPPQNDPPKKVWQWAPGELAGEWKTIDIDLTQHCPDAASYQLDFRATSGSKPLEIQSLQFVYEGTIVPGFIQRIAHHEAQQYALTITALGKSFGVRAVLRLPAGESTSQGIVTIAKRPL